MLSNFLNFYLPKNNRCYENYVYLSNISIRCFVLLAYPLLFLILCIFVNSLVMLLLCCYFSVYHCIWLYENKDIYTITASINIYIFHTFSMGVLDSNCHLNQKVSYFFYISSRYSILYSPSGIFFSATLEMK
jgi:hypothetical protein